MDEFDHRGHQPVVTLRTLLFGLTVAESAGEEREQHGPEPLAACTDDVGGDGADQGDGAVEALLDDPIDFGEIFRDDRIGVVGFQDGKLLCVGLTKVPGSGKGPCLTAGTPGMMPRCQTGRPWERPDYMGGWPMPIGSG